MDYKIKQKIQTQNHTTLKLWHDDEFPLLYFTFWHEMLVMHMIYLTGGWIMIELLPCF